MKKDVALVLSSGGPRGWAYIGAIEELISRGYRIRSVAGTSIGSLIGGIYAAGKLEEIKEWLFTLDAWKVFTLMDLSLSKNHLMKGDKVISALKEIVPNVNIEDMEIPYCAVAADLYTGEEVVFDRGPLFDAIRASLNEAKETKGMPTCIVMHSTKGKGVSFMEGKAGWHGKAPIDEEYAIAMADLAKIDEELAKEEA